ncbi:3'-5' exonuclease [Massilia sp. W12]|uniref:3'-5' exonuclease n=1 Tax=Massilia sp. W12 TaxID=3126507 RepID=UPI0030D1E898
MSTAAEGALPVFRGLTLAQIAWIDSPAAMLAALPDLQACSMLGLDTESRPTFVKGEKSDGPHLLQLASTRQAWLFPLQPGAPLWPELADLLQSEAVLKIGFGLRNDVRHMQRRFGWKLHPVMDLSRELRENRHQEIGARGAVARWLQQDLHKPRSITTSNWARLPLSEAQKLYAANDAYAALQVYLRWQEQGGVRPLLKRTP